MSSEDRPGDPACWLRFVCPQCGAVAEAAPPAGASPAAGTGLPAECPQCHARLTG